MQSVQRGSFVRSFEAVVSRHPEEWVGVLIVCVRDVCRYSRAAIAMAICVVAPELVSSGNEVLRPVPSTAAVDVVRSAVQCGPNSIFMFMILCGVDVQKSAVDSIECTSEGASLLDLSTFALEHGVNVEIRQLSPAEFELLPTPAICQTNGSGGRSAVRHFVVAHAVDSHGILAIDGTTGECFRIPFHRIESYLSGYAMIRKSSPIQRLFQSQGWILTTLLTANVWVAASIALARYRLR